MRKVKGTIHWVSADHAQDAEVRLYDRLFRSEDPGGGGRDPLDDLNPKSLERIEGAKVEPALASAAPGERFQFERQGYFCVDPDSRAGKLVFNRTVTLKDSWAKIQSRTK
jgi:glutaminyl-tRNA synthetase